MIRLSWFAPFALVLGSPLAAHAEEEDVSYQLETSVASSYVARGIVQYADRGIASSQNTASVKLEHVGRGSLTFGLWNATALGDFDAQPGTALEFDLSATYGFNAGPVAVTTGYTAYLFPGHVDGTPFDGGHEVFGTAAYDNKYVVPTVSVWAEFVHQQGAYVTLGGSHDFHVSKKCTLSPAVSVGAAAYRKYLGTDHVAAPHLNDVTAGLSGRIELPGGTYAALRVSYSLRTTPDELMEEDSDWGMAGRSTLVGVVALGVAR